MTPSGLQAALREPGLWREVRVLRSLPSTNDALKGLAARGAAAGTVVLAREQTAGKGRAGRRWHSPRGGLWLSALFRPPFPLERAGCLAVTSAVSIAQALRGQFGLEVQVKWPNDLWLAGQKLGGLLVELATCDRRIDWLIVGVGLNVNNPLPSGLAPAPVSLLQALGKAVPLTVAAGTVLDALSRGYEGLLREGFGPVRRRFDALSALGPWVRFRRGQQEQAGRVLGLAEDGKLRVKTEFGTVLLLAAEEVHLIPSQGRQRCQQPQC